MTNQGTKTYTINPGGSQTIPQGYHSGSGKVTANANQNSGTYTFASGSTGTTVDMGVNNTYRYVNATNVYNKGKADGGGVGLFSSTILTGGTTYSDSVNKTVYTFTTSGDVFVDYTVSSSETGSCIVELKDSSGNNKMYFFNYSYNTTVQPGYSESRIKIIHVESGDYIFCTNMISAVNHRATIFSYKVFSNIIHT